MVNLIASCTLDNSSNIIPQELDQNAFSLLNPSCQQSVSYHQNMEPYTLIINLEKEKKDVYTLNLNMILEDGSFFVSPLSKGNFTG